MKQLENKTLDSRREMEIADAIDDLRSHKARLQRVQMDDATLLQMVHERPDQAAVAAAVASASMDLDEQDLDMLGAGDSLQGLTLEDISLLKQMRDKGGPSYRPVLSSSLRKGSMHPNSDEDEDDIGSDVDDDGDMAGNFGSGASSLSKSVTAQPQKPQQKPVSMFSRAAPVASVAAPAPATGLPFLDEAETAPSLVDYD